MTGRTKILALIFSTTAVVGAAALIAGVAVFARWAKSMWEGDPYPAARPAATAERLDGHTQSVYDALGLPRARLDDDRPGRGMEAGGSACPRQGLRHLPENLRDTPPAEPGVVDVREEWALKGVPRAEAEPALERVRHHLTRQGWKVIRFDDSTPGHELWLHLKHPRTGDTIRVATNSEDRLSVSAYAECARYPSDTERDYYGALRLPPQQAPAQLRRTHSPA
ncbi:hypothetical protein [Streptomyces luteireticuli]|uniref:Uncharacterized protein n=1 Tax=Streptomyces luteireticuli TaxID=173858 RepID=A0ABN0Z408_9ACTN